MDIPPEALAAARQAQAATGASDVAAALALAVAWPESGYDPNARGDWMIGGRIVPRGTAGAIPTSFGYTQLHNRDGGDGGGLGGSLSGDELLDPVRNFSIAEAEIQRRLDQGADQLGAIGPWSTRSTAIGLVDEALGALAGLPANAAAAVQAVSGTDAGQSLPAGALVVGAAAIALWLVLED